MKLYSLERYKKGQIKENLIILLAMTRTYTKAVALLSYCREAWTAPMACLYLILRGQPCSIMVLRVLAAITIDPRQTSFR